MFIADVEVMDSTKRVIPSNVWLQRPDYINDFGRGTVYMSILNGLFKISCGTAKREINVLPVPSIQRNEINGQIIKRGPEIMDGIAHDSSEFVRQSLSSSENYLVWAVRLLLDHRGIWITRKETSDHRIEIRDMAIGPFNL
jgi:hypothetical protein